MTEHFPSADLPGVTVSPRAVELVRQFQVLKRVPRTGWLLRGVPASEAENVAAHTCGVGLLALLLVDLVDEPIDRGRLLSICLIHDLAESVVGDLPGPASRYFPSGAKQEAEAQVLLDLLGGLALADSWMALWQEFEAASSPEGRLARDADRLDMLFQAAAYEDAGRRGLDEFWEDADALGWHYPQSVALLRRLAASRPGTMS